MSERSNPVIPDLTKVILIGGLFLLLLGRLGFQGQELAEAEADAAQQLLSRRSAQQRAAELETEARRREGELEQRQERIAALEAALDGRDEDAREVQRELRSLREARDEAGTQAAAADRRAAESWSARAAEAADRGDALRAAAYEARALSLSEDAAGRGRLLTSLQAAPRLLGDAPARLEALRLRRDPRGRELALLTRDGRALRLDLATRRVCGTLELGELITDIAWGPDGERLAAVGELGTLALWRRGERHPRWQRARPLREIESDRSPLIAFASEDELMLVSPDGLVERWGCADGRILGEVDLEGAPVISLLERPVTGQLAVGLPGKLGYVRAGRDLSAEQRLPLNPFSLAAFPEQRIIAVTSDLGTLLVEIGSLGIVSLNDTDGPQVGAALAASPSQTILAVAEPGGVALWEVATRRNLKTIAPITTARRGEVPVYEAIAFGASDDELYAAVRGAPLTLWSTETGAALARGDGAGGAILALRQRPESASPERQARRRYVAGLEESGNVRLWAEAEGGPRLALSLYSRARALTWTRDGRFLVTAGPSVEDGTESLEVWNVDDQRRGQTLIPRPGMRGIRSPATVLSPLADGRRLASGHEDGSLRLWDIPTGQERMVLPSHEAPVRALAAHAEMPWVASGDAAGGLRVTDFEGGATIARLDLTGSAIAALAFLPSGRGLLVAPAAGPLLTWTRDDGLRPVTGSAALTGVTELRPSATGLLAAGPALGVGWLEGGDALTLSGRVTALGARPCLDEAAPGELWASDETGQLQRWRRPETSPGAALESPPLAIAATAEAPGFAALTRRGLLAGARRGLLMPAGEALMSPDGRFAAVVSDSGWLLYDISEAPPRRLGVGAPATAFAFAGAAPAGAAPGGAAPADAAPADAALAVAEAGDEEAVIAVYELSGGVLGAPSRRLRLPRGGAPARALTWLPGGGIAAGCGDELRVYGADGALAWSQRLEAPITALLAADEALLSVTLAGELRSWSAEGEGSPAILLPAAATQLVASRGLLACAGPRGELWAQPLAAPERLMSLRPARREAGALRLSADASRLWIADDVGVESIPWEALATALQPAEELGAEVAARTSLGARGGELAPLRAERLEPVPRADAPK